MQPKRAVLNTPELRRVMALPRRRWTEEELGPLAEKLTAELKTPMGTMKLRPVQALALHEIRQHGGLFGPIRVGGGKTLISFLASVILGAKRPMLLLPAALIEKTLREMRESMKHWRIDRNLRPFSYEMLGRAGAANELDFYKPDLLICDETHRLKNKKAAVTRRVGRYLKEHPETRVIAISGSILKHSLKDFSHILTWALRDGAPVSHNTGEVIDWAEAMDPNVTFLRKVHAGALLALCNDEERAQEPATAARLGFQRRLLDTPGVVATQGENVGASLLIKSRSYPVAPTTEKNFETLRKTWCTPDGWALSEATAVWRCARELALGLHYVWDPRPPAEWLTARYEWACFVRDVLSRSRTLDSELQVANAVARGELSDPSYETWAKIRKTFKANSKAVWHDELPLLHVADWMKKGPGIVWCEHVFFARELSRRTGAPYFGQQGLDADGKTIESASGDQCIIASVAANGTGRNLQKWNRNLITSCLTGADTWEQLLGRTHRDGQEADEVTCDVMIGCLEHIEAWQSAIVSARAAEQMLGQPQKLLFADIDVDVVPPNSSSRWRK